MKYEFYTSDKNAGGHIRPGNWMHRVASWIATFEHNRLNYNTALMPVVYRDKCCLRINKTQLKREFPEMYESIIGIIILLDAKLMEIESYEN